MSLTRYRPRQIVRYGAPVAGSLLYGPARRYIADNLPRLYNRALAQGRGLLSRAGEAPARPRSARGLRVESARSSAIKSAAWSNSQSSVPRQMTYGQQVEVAGGESKSTFTLINPKPKLSKDYATNTVVRSSGFSQAVTQGVQSAQTVGAYLTAGDIYNQFTIAGGNSDDDSGLRMFFGHCHGETLITNAESTNAHFMIYDILAKTDGQATHNIDPANCFAVSGIDAAGGAAANYTIPGCDFSFNPRTRAFYKVLQKTPVTLSPGATHTHYVNYGYNKHISQERIRALAAATGNYPVGGISLYTVIICHGTPVHDDTTETSVTLGISKLDIVLKEYYTVRWLGQINNTNSITTTLATNLTGFQMAEGAPADIADAS